MTARSRLRLGDVLRVGSVGLRSRPLRATLSGLGVAIGIAAIVGVLGISESSRADLLARLDRIGTNLLTVAPGQGFLGEDATLPTTAPAMIGRIGPVESVASTASVSAKVRRSDRISVRETGGIAVRTTDLALPQTVGATVRSGRWLDAATAGYPTVVLGDVAAQRLGVGSAGIDGHPVQVWLGDRWFTVIGILDPIPLAPELDRSALIGQAVAKDLLGWDGDPGMIYVRSQPDATLAVRAVLARTVNPEKSEGVQVSRPSDAIAAKAEAKGAFTSLLLGLGVVALLVGGVGIANVMFVSVLERRSEIGLRRALGATRRHVAVQFVTESLLLSAAGGGAGVALGAAITIGYAHSRGWTTVVPATGALAGLGAAIGTGALAGLQPAVRAARQPPSEALRSV